MSLLALFRREPRYIYVDVEQKPHPDPDIEEFAIWLEDTTNSIPDTTPMSAMEYWRIVADRAADAGFLRYAGPHITK